jgi:Mg2+ and Co2+ transporter CorA
MNWYKRAKSLQDIAWDPAPGKEQDYEKVHLDSDVSAIFEQIYPEDPSTSSFNIDEEIESAILQLVDYGGDNSMWKYFLRKENKEPNSDQAKYLQKVKDKVKHNYIKLYEDRKKLDEGQVNIEQQQGPGGAPGGAPPMM